MYFTLGYHRVKYLKCEKIGFFQGGSGYMCGQTRMV